MSKLFRRLLIIISFVGSLPLFSQGTVTPAAHDEFAKKKQETKFTEVVTTDSLPAAELLKRAMNWIKSENPAYVISGGTSTSGKAECTISFLIKPKELNPQVDYTGKVTMKVVIECKGSKYRYTVSDIRHISKSGKTTGGSIDSFYPECGSQIMPEILWKKIKGEAIRDAGVIVVAIKDAMKIDSSTGSKEDW